MKIRVGYELIYDFPRPTPMITVLGTHFTRAPDVITPDYLTTSPSVPISPYRDTFGNWCSRIVAPAGRFRLSADGVVHDTGLPDVVVPRILFGVRSSQHDVIVASVFLSCIVGTLKRNMRRYTFGRYIEVIDAGLRLADITGLQREASGIDSKSRSKAIANLKTNGATPEEIEFLLDWRVELNALTSDELVAWIKGKLDHHGIKKIIPDDTVLADAYRRASECKVIQKAI